MKIKHLVSVGFLSNVIEWYDFSIYAYMAGVIGQLFFASSSVQVSLIKSFFLFSVSYLFRPIGSILFGFLADKYGVGKIFKILLLLMAIPSFLIALLPTSSHFLVLSTTALIILRIIQGFAAGGELPLSNCYLYNNAPKGRENFICSFAASSSMLGVLCGSLIATALHFLFSDTQIMAWAWRLPFVIGFLLTVFIFYIRRGISTQNLPSLSVKSAVATLAMHKRQVLVIIAINAFISVSFYTLFVWMPSYLKYFIGFNSQVALLSNSIAMLLLIALTLLWATLPQKHSYKLTLMSIISIPVMAYPLFYLVKIHPTIVMLLLSQVLFSIALSFIQAIIMRLMASSFTDSVRCLGVSIVFTLPTAVFGGAIPVLTTYIIHQTGFILTPVCFLIAVSIIALLAVVIDNNKLFPHFSTKV